MYSLATPRSLNILSAALTAATTFEVEFDQVGENLLRVHELTAAFGKVSRDEFKDADSEPDTFSITIQTMTGTSFPLVAHADTTVGEVKQLIENEQRIRIQEQRLISAGRQLEDRFTLRDYNIEPDFHLHLVPRARGAGNRLVLSTTTLAPQFDFDFTHVMDDGMSFVRGGEPYRRPYGWMRFALDVKGQFGDDVWLGEDGIRTGSCVGEWAVSYHATGKWADRTIAQTGYELSLGTSLGISHGIYSTPDINVAQKYATEFTFEGSSFAVVLQNRVNPLTLRKLKAAEHEIGEFWLNPRKSELRPYGILVKKL